MTHPANNNEPDAMRQQVNAFVKLTYDADASLDVDQLTEQLHNDIERLRDADSDSRIELQSYNVKHVAQEAEIYGNERPVNFREIMSQTYTAWRSAIDCFEHYVQTGYGDPVALAKAAMDAERAFIEAHSFAF